MARYQDAVAWVAYNDDAVLRDLDDLNTIARQTTVLLVADVWGKDPHSVASKVLKLRWEEDDNRR